MYTLYILHAFCVKKGKNARENGEPVIRNVRETTIYHMRNYDSRRGATMGVCLRNIIGAFGFLAK